MEDSFVRQALLSLNRQPSPVIQNFFSDSNLSKIQSTLRTQVKFHTGESIDDQSCNEIYTVMKYVYNSFGKNKRNFNDEVNRLNDLVLKELVPMVTSNVLSHLQYIKDISSLPTPMEYGKTTSVKGDNSLELKSF
jgi:hypothetical protein